MVINRLFPETPSEIIKKLQLQLHQSVFEELRETYLKGLPKLFPIQKPEGIVLQDSIYFLGGRPLIYWMQNGAMGLKICHRVDDQDDVYQMLEGFRWRTAKELHGSRLLSHLDDEYIFWNSSPEEKEKSTLYGNGCRRRPRTYNGSNS